MRVLFDHNLPHDLRTSLGKQSGHEIVTAAYLGWHELKNGKLLQKAEDNGIEVLLTGDRTLIHEQNLAGRCLAIVVLSTNNRYILKDFVAPILLAIRSATPGSVQLVDCGKFSRKRH